MAKKYNMTTQVGPAMVLAPEVEGCNYPPVLLFALLTVVLSAAGLR